MTERLKASKLNEFLIDDAARLNFSDLRICSVGKTGAGGDQNLQQLKEFVSNQFHGTMDWLSQSMDRRAKATNLWPEAKSIILVSMSYGPDVDPLANLDQPDKANISIYARNKDYHDIIKGKLKELAGRFAARSGADVKVFVDTAPVMEKPLGQKAGLGWQGKHTNLVSQKQGSWFFIGSIFTDIELEADAPEIDHCGSCTACLDSCPTDAFPAPYKIDARRCISYLTIEHKGPIDIQFRPKIGNRIYGCDDCLAACPWNKFAVEANEIKLTAREDLIAPRIKDLIGMDDETFRTFFSRSPVKRIGRNRFIRNILIAAGNSGDKMLIPACKRHLDDQDEIVRGSAVWALSQLMSKNKLKDLKHQHKDEQSTSVLTEWDHALKQEAI